MVYRKGRGELLLLSIVGDGMEGRKEGGKGRSGLVCGVDRGFVV